MGAEEFVPEEADLPELARASQGCRGCELYQRATQTVFGRGPGQAALMLVGEQPGDQEDRQGSPFVGPAGHLLDECLERAGLDVEQLYITNAVKHFKFEMRGARRLHKKPSAREVGACRPWLLAEIDVVRPDLIVALGATAAQTLLGPAARITRDRGRALDGPEGRRVLVTIHPSALLRMTDADEKDAEIDRFVEDLLRARELVAS